ncbi:hypothetical protein PUR71_00620, partial [Streptomyces sp. SP17BM10]|nr:hypothetical protein [Streptomyces sp. SP17BM10]
IAERRFPILVLWSEVAAGGHFPALEVPELLAGDLRSFARAVRAHEAAAEQPKPAPVPSHERDRRSDVFSAALFALVLGVTAPGDSKVTAVIRRKAEKLTADQGGKVTIDQLRELGLSRRTATDLRR